VDGLGGHHGRLQGILDRVVGAPPGPRARPGPRAACRAAGRWRAQGPEPSGTRCASRSPLAPPMPGPRASATAARHPPRSQAIPIRQRCSAFCCCRSRHRPTCGARAVIGRVRSYAPRFNKTQWIVVLWCMKLHTARRRVICSCLARRAVAAGRLQSLAARGVASSRPCSSTQPWRRSHRGMVVPEAST
jgi:hypothetical protein